MKQRLAILGSTGSIGVQTLDIVRENPDFFEVRVLTANSNWQRLAAQAREFDADTAVIADKRYYTRLRDALEDTDVKVYAGEPDTKTFPLLQAAYDALAADNGATIVLNAANEIAVEAFLEGRIGFTDIFSTVRGMLESILAPLPGSVDEIIELDRAVRAKTRERLAVR